MMNIIKAFGKAIKEVTKEAEYASGLWLEMTKEEDEELRNLGNSLMPGYPTNSSTPEYTAAYKRIEARIQNTRNPQRARMKAESRAKHKANMARLKAAEDAA